MAHHAGLHLLGHPLLNQRYGRPILITENGMANTDFVMLDGKVHDPQRIDYVHRHLLAPAAPCRRATR